MSSYLPFGSSSRVSRSASTKHHDPSHHRPKRTGTDPTSKGGKSRDKKMESQEMTKMDSSLTNQHSKTFLDVDSKNRDPGAHHISGRLEDDNGGGSQSEEGQNDDKHGGPSSGERKSTQTGSPEEDSDEDELSHDDPYVLVNKSSSGKPYGDALKPKDLDELLVRTKNMKPDTAKQGAEAAYKKSSGFRAQTTSSTAKQSPNSPATSSRGRDPPEGPRTLKKNQPAPSGSGNLSTSIKGLRHTAFVDLKGRRGNSQDLSRSPERKFRETELGLQDSVPPGDGGQGPPLPPKDALTNDNEKDKLILELEQKIADLNEKAAIEKRSRDQEVKNLMDKVEGLMDQIGDEAVKDAEKDKQTILDLASNVEYLKRANKELTIGNHELTQKLEKLQGESDGLSPAYIALRTDYNELKDEHDKAGEVYQTELKNQNDHLYAAYLAELEKRVEDATKVHKEEQARAIKEEQVKGQTLLNQLRGEVSKEKELKNKLLRSMGEMQQADRYKQDIDYFKTKIESLRFEIKNWARNQVVTPSQPTGRWYQGYRGTFSPDYTFFKSVVPYYSEYTQDKSFRLILQAYLWQFIGEHIFQQDLWVGADKRLPGESNSNADYYIPESFKILKRRLQPDEHSSNDYHSEYNIWRSTTARVLDARLPIPRRQLTLEMLRNRIIADFEQACPGMGEDFDIEDLDSILKSASEVAVQMAQQRAQYELEFISKDKYGVQEFVPKVMTDPIGCEVGDGSRTFRAVMLTLSPRLVRIGNADGGELDKKVPLVPFEVETREMQRGRPLIPPRRHEF